MKIKASLVNNQCIFDSGEFDTAEEAMQWARGRGGRYLLHMTSGDPYSKHFKVISLIVDDDANTFIAK